MTTTVPDATLLEAVALSCFVLYILQNISYRWYNYHYYYM